MWKLPIAVLVVVVVGYLLLVGLPVNNTSTPSAPIAITLGFVGPLSGDGANLGQNAKAGVELAVSEINAAGGINGKPLQFIYEDGKCNGKDAVNAANKLISVDKVPVILGGACSSETASFAPIAEQSKVVVLSYCSSAPKITDAGDYIFRDYPSDLFQGSYAANYIYDTLKKTKVAILYVKSDWGVGIKDVFTDAFKKLGGTVLIEEGFEQTNRDFRTQLTKIKSKKPQLVYFLGYTEESIAGIKQAAELKLGVPLFGGDAWDDPKIFSAAGKAADGIMYSVVASPTSAEFKAKMKAKIGSDDLLACTPTAYDGVYVLARALKQAGTDATKIKDELYKTVYVDGVSAPEIRFDKNGDLVGAAYVVKLVRDGKAVEQ